MKKLLAVLLVMLSVTVFGQFHSEKSDTHTDSKNWAPIIPEQNLLKILDNPISGDVYEIGNIYAKDYDGDPLNYEIIISSSDAFSIIGNKLYYEHFESVYPIWMFYLVIQVTDGHIHPMNSEAQITVHLEY